MNVGSLPGPSTATAAGAPAVVLVSAPWATPSRPAPTVLWELSRRWGPALHAVLIEPPSEELLDLLAIDSLPTWLRFRPGSVNEPSAPGELEVVEEPSASAEPCVVAELVGTSSSGEAITLPGPWTLVHRRTGALPKHVVEAEFGPQS